MTHHKISASTLARTAALALAALAGCERFGASPAKPAFKAVDITGAEYARELALPDAITEGLAEFFAQHLRSRLDARRIQRAHSRLSLVTRQPQELQERPPPGFRPARRPAACQSSWRRRPS